MPTGIDATGASPWSPARNTSRRPSGVLHAKSSFPSRESAIGRTCPDSNSVNDAAAAGVFAMVPGPADRAAAVELLPSPPGRPALHAPVTHAQARGRTAAPPSRALPDRRIGEGRCGLGNDFMALLFGRDSAHVAVHRFR